MKKFYSLLMGLFMASFGFSQSITIFEAYAILNVNSAGNAYYDLNLDTSNPNFVSNLGTFANTQSVVLAGGQNLTLKCNGGDVTGGNIYYRIYDQTATPGTFTPISLNWVSDWSGACGSTSNQTWNTTSNTTNILAGLPNGNYYLEIYTEATGTPANAYISNSGSNYKASFSIDNTLAVDDIKGINTKSIVSAGKLYTAKKGNLNIQVMDFSGRLIKTLNVKSTGNEIELNLPTKGNYILKISNGSQSEVLKFAY